MKETRDLEHHACTAQVPPSELGQGQRLHRPLPSHSPTGQLDKIAQSNVSGFSCKKKRRERMFIPEGYLRIRPNRNTNALCNMSNHMAKEPSQLQSQIVRCDLPTISCYQQTLPHARKGSGKHKFPSTQVPFRSHARHQKAS